MKFGLVLSTNATRFSAVSYSGDLERDIGRAAALGYDGVELAVRDPALVDADRLKKYILSAGVAVPAIGTGQAFLEEGLSFTDSRKEIRRKAVDRIKAHVRFAAGFKAAVIIGLIRGRGGKKREAEDKFLAECLAKCAAYALREGSELFLEPLNRYETKLVNTVDEGLALIRSLKFKNLKLLVDTFHMNIEEPSIYGSMVKAFPCLGHVHFADSNRRPAGCGHLNFMDIVGVLKGIGYNRYISMEMEPWPTPDEAAQVSIEHVKNIESVSKSLNPPRSATTPPAEGNFQAKGRSACG